MGDCDCGADMAVELEAGLNADRDPTSEFVTELYKGRNGVFENEVVFNLA